MPASVTLDVVLYHGPGDLVRLPLKLKWDKIFNKPFDNGPFYPASFYKLPKEWQAGVMKHGLFIQSASFHAPVFQGRPTTIDAASIEAMDASMMEDIESRYKGIQLAERIGSVISQEISEPMYGKEYVRLLSIGIEIMDGYSHYKIREGMINYLNPEGESVLVGMRDLLRRAKEAGFIWDQKTFGELRKFLRHTPTVLSPNEDLFVDVLAGLTEEQLKILVHQDSLSPTLILNLTQGCTNQCVMCSGSKEKGRVFSMPFPIAAAILLKMRRYSHTLRPWTRTDAMDYHDSFVGATAADVFSFADKSKWKILLATNKPGSTTIKNVIERMKKSWFALFQVSLHANYEPVVQYARDVYENKIGQEEKMLKRQSLVDLYTRRYVVLLEALHRADINFIITFQESPSEDFINLLKSNNKSLAVAVLEEMYSIGKEVLTNVESKGLLKNTLVYEVLTNWEGDSLLFLQSLGVDARMMESFGDNLGSSFVKTSPISFAINADGRLDVMFRGSSNLVKLQEIFPDPDSSSPSLFLCKRHS